MPPAHLARAQRIEDDVACQFQQMAILFDEDCLVSALKHVADTAVAAVNRLRVHPIELAHALGKIAFSGLHHHVVVIDELHSHNAARLPSGGADRRDNPHQQKTSPCGCVLAVARGAAPPP